MPGKDKEQPKADPLAVEPADTGEVRELGPEDEVADPGAEAADESGEGDELSQLRAENARLRDKLAAAGISPDEPQKPHAPSFGISEGIRDQLEREGKAVDPFTGKSLTRDDLK
jgi:hypothetical protein